MRYPAPLKPSGKIAVTAPSSGIEEALLPRLTHILQSLKEKGFKIVEGDCLYGNAGYVSAHAGARAAELMRFALDPDISAIIPPFGGELATEILPLLDFEELKKATPKWIVGYSDISTITTAITSCCDWATVHSACLMELLPEQTDTLTPATLDNLNTEEMGSFTQNASSHFQNTFPDWQENPLYTFHLTQRTKWKQLATQVPIQTPIKLRGRLFGGCLDTLVNLFDTRFVDFGAFKHNYAADGVLLYLENVEFSPMGLNRTLHSLDFRGVFDDINGLLLGRSTGPEDPKGMLHYENVIKEFFAHKPFPVLYDLDIGHRAPNMTLINGAIANVELHNEKGTLTQTLVP